jgi:hypothetical protein
VSAFAGDTTTVYVEVTERRDEFVAALRVRRVAAEIEAGAVVIDSVDDHGYDLIRDALVASGAPLRRLAPRRRALTELFRGEQNRSRA